MVLLVLLLYLRQHHVALVLRDSGSENSFENEVRSVSVAISVTMENVGEKRHRNKSTAMSRNGDMVPSFTDMDFVMD